MSSLILFDLSRLLSRANQPAATGIDRVELAYAKQLVATARDRVSFVALNMWGQIAQLPFEDSAKFINALDGAWRGNSEETQPRRRVETLAHRVWAHALLHGERDLVRSVRHWNKIVYVLVSHHHLDRPGVVQRLKRATGALFVPLIHDLIPMEFPQYARPGEDARHRRRMETVARFADAVIANSNTTMQALESYLRGRNRRPPVVVAPLGIENHLLTRADPVLLEKPYFACVGTIEPRKNHKMLLDVWRTLQADLGDNAPSLVLLGRRGWMIDHVIEVIENSNVVSGLVRELNALPDEEMKRFVAGARAALLPSFAEGFGLTMPEALSMGVPALCSDLPSLREIGRDVPEYLDPHDKSAWYDAVVDYSRLDSGRRQAQSSRLSAWRPPRWEAHFATVQPVLDGQLARA